MARTFHLSFAPEPLEPSPTVLRATLRRDGDDPAAAISHVVQFSGELRELARELAKGPRGTPNQEVLADIRSMLLEVLRGGASGDAAFLARLELVLGSAEARLVVHPVLDTPDLDGSTQRWLEHLPWSTLDLETNGKLQVVLHAEPGDHSLEPHRRRIAKNALETPRQLRVLCIVGTLDQSLGVDNALPAARASIEALRQVARETKGVVVEFVATETVIQDLAIDGLGAHTVQTVSDLERVLRGETALHGETRWDVVHFLSHSNAALRVPLNHFGGPRIPEATYADALRLGLDRDLTANDLAACFAATPDGRQHNQSTVLAVFECCNIGSTFVRPLLQHLDHAIGTLGLVSPKLGPLWLDPYYRTLLGLDKAATFGSVGRAVLEARRGIRDTKDTACRDLRERDWQLTQWSSVADDRPFGTADAITLREYGLLMRETLANLQGVFDRHSLRTKAIPLAVELVADKQPPEEQHENDARQRSSDLPMGADRTLLQIVGIGGAYFLLGEPGGGKTVSERHAAWHLLEKLQLDDAKAAERTVIDPDARIPLYLRLPDWVRNGGSPDLESLVRHTLLPLPNLNEESRTRIVKLLQNETRRLVLLLDGWDEIPSDGDGIERARNLVKALVETQEQPHAIVVACRFAARPDPLAEVTELRVLRLDRPEQVAVLARWLARGATPEPAADAVAEAQRVLEHIDRQPGTLRNLLRTPLYLGLLGLVLTPEGTDTRTPDLKQIHRRHEFLHEVICKLLTNGHRRRLTKPEEGAQNDWLRRQLRVLRELAFIMLCDGVLEVDYEDLKARLLELDETHSDRLRGEFESAGILRPNSRAEPNGRWAFQHRSLLEALAGQHLAAHAALSRTQDQLSERDKARAQRRIQALQSIRDLRKHQKRKSEDPARFWVEPFSLAAGYVGKDAESWIRWLLQHNELRPIGLAAVALADSEHVGADLLLDVLEKNRDVDWEERRVVYESLLPPLGRGFDPAVRQALLKFVAHERVTEGEWRIDRGELWFVDQVFVHVAEDQAQPVDVRQIAESQRRELMRAVGARDLPEKIVGMLLELPRSVSKGRDTDSYWRFVPARAARLDESAQRARTHAVERARDGRVHNGHANDFWVAEVHVTDSFWGLFAGTSRACTTHDARRTEPATGVNWYQATMFARWLTVLLGDAGSPAGTEVSLPTAWEWDLTARWHPDNLSPEAARQDPPHGWAIVAAPATSDGKPVETIVPVTADSLDENFGKRRPEPGPCGSPARRHNPLGLRDMIRFLWTWCKDTPRSIGSSDRRILRGGSCNSLARLCAIDFQDTNSARRSSRYCGIRLSMHRTQNLASCCACGHGDNHD